MPKTLTEFDVTPPRHAQLRIYYMKKRHKYSKNSAWQLFAQLQFDSIWFDSIDYKIKMV